MRQIKDLPGPRALPLVGNAFQVTLASRSEERRVGKECA